MRVRRRLSLLFFIGVLTAGSTALSYYYYYFYEPPLKAGETFLQAMENRDIETLRGLVVMTPSSNLEELGEPTEEDLQELLAVPFHRGRVLYQKKRGGPSRDYHYLIYRQPDGTIYALLLMRMEDDFRVVIPRRRHNPQAPYLWEYTWTN